MALPQFACQQELPSRFHGQAGDRRGEAQQFEALGVFAADHLATGGQGGGGGGGGKTIGKP